MFDGDTSSSNDSYYLRRVCFEIEPFYSVIFSQQNNLTVNIKNV